MDGIVGLSAEHKTDKKQFGGMIATSCTPHRLKLEIIKVFLARKMAKGTVDGEITEYSTHMRVNMQFFRGCFRNSRGITSKIEMVKNGLVDFLYLESIHEAKRG